MENAFNEQGVSVNRHGLSCAGLVFALRDIRGVEVVTVDKDWIVPVAISLLGVTGLVAGLLHASSAAIVVGAMLIVVGWLTWSSQDVTHRLMVETPEGTREAVVSVDPAFLDRVAQAIRAAQAAQAAAPSPAPAKR
ncbi:DUF6232 family protein [Burkholderia glumae]|uniref:DUF6232 family protein n=1 Tax=Burkholderia glumae TaxID=337 RepID=A0AAQ0BTG6_BURGL|nr:DUF6232 family protein [Burkholderia glumae]ACR32449.1 Hypothetical protein bglu_2g21440 [Burkholderia glumae BGR1]AJY63289.1 hypothetical protein KS03_3783 [Burkholderia glumae LMG 2196 = ATCC 33617]KHJ59337.1 hypothetical protein NCPPB3923_29935 [Burkholderia glumae]MCM2484357.1 DUF6232 family protein [Burkholderia glumae]MCM2494720.1 DUF6232 family protein [Burkholderia glumae]